MQRRRLILTGVVAIVAIAVFFIIRGNLGSENPRTKAMAVVTALMRKDWAAIYDTASPRELKVQGWTKAGFAKLMDAVGGQTDFGHITLQQGPVYPQGTTAEYLLKFSTATPCYVGDQEWRKEFTLVMRKDEAGAWYLDIGTLPVLINRFGPADWRERLRRLKNAMETASISQLVDLKRNRRVTPNSLEQDLRSPTAKLSWVI